jgi:hypothetical protein
LLVALALAGCGVHAGVNGNDTAGIIPWSPEAELAALDLAGEHCARYGKAAIVTGVNRGPGYFINFICTFMRDGRPVRY